MLYRKIFAPLLASLLLTFVCSCAEGPKISVGNEVNVLLITIDSLRADHLGCYGYEQTISPTIDFLARGGVRFENCISQAPITPTSHASILTGLDPYRHGIRMFGWPGPDNPVTLATLLRDAGYRTAAFVSTAALEKSKFGPSQGFDLYEQSFYRKTAEKFYQEKQFADTRRQQNPVQRRADLTTALVKQWLHDLEEGPFFLWVHYMDPHETFLVPPLIPGFFMYSYQRPLTDIHFQLYDIEIRFVDLMLQSLLKELHQLGFGDNTLIIVTSDHGQGLSNHNYEYHCRKLYQEQIRIPLIFSGKSVPAGREVNTIVRSTDIAPTVLNILKYPAESLPQNFDGINLQPFWEDPENHNPRQALIYSETLYPELVDKTSALYSIIEGNYKLIYRAGQEDESELYDLENDPHELENLYSERPEIARRLVNKFKSIQQGPKGEVSRDKEWEDQLRSLGYLGGDMK